MPEIILNGCTLEPLMSYLKALGVLRLVSEQIDPQAKGRWSNGEFVLHSALDERGLINFIVNDYQPSPVFAPWNGDGGFLTETGASQEIIELVRKSSDVRLQLLTFVVRAIDEVRILRDFKAARESTKYLNKKKQKLQRLGSVLSAAEAEALRSAIRRVEEVKQTILSEVRANFPDPVVRWMDACLVIKAGDFVTAPLMGSGGCDGRLEFSANFIGNVLKFLKMSSTEREQLVERALFGRGDAKLVATSIGQFSPGQVGGPNATQGLEGKSLANPLDFVMMIEGGFLFAGTVARKMGAANPAKGVFPFTVFSSSVGNTMDVPKDSQEARGEIWLPVWPRFSGLAELTQVFSEGRAQLGKVQASSGVQIARAVTSLGVDRGIEGFVRFGFLKRSGKAFLATPLGRIEVQARPEVDLLREMDPWLDGFRRAALDDMAPPRFRVVLHRIEKAVFEFCQFGGAARFGSILSSFGRAERELAIAERFRGDHPLRPISGLSSAWLEAANDNTVEFELALSLATIWDAERKMGPIRENLEPVRIRTDKRGGPIVTWAEEDHAVVWTGANFLMNLISILERRLMDGKRLGCKGLSLDANRYASLGAISAFLHGEVNDERISELLWGIVLVAQGSHPPRFQFAPIQAPPFPRSFAMLKLLFLPFALTESSGEVIIRPEGQVISILRAGRVGDACALAARRLRASGVMPLTSRRGGKPIAGEEWWCGDVDPLRLAGALLLPVSRKGAQKLVDLVARPLLGEREAVS